MSRRYTPVNISELSSNEVFVFGTNSRGFHGAGAAGVAFRGVAANTWRDDVIFQKALHSPQGSLERVGRWAILGQARGLMIGISGQSYGIETITNPGAKRSVPLDVILNQILDLCLFAKKRSDLIFLVSKIGCGLAGYSESEIKHLFVTAHAHTQLPGNVILPRELECRD